MLKEFLNGSELARLCGVTKQAVSTATREGRLHRDPVTKKYDPGHSTNLAFIQKNRAKLVTAELIDDSTELSTDIRPGDVPETLEDLYRQKLQMDIDYKKAQKRALDLKFSLAKEHLVPGSMVGIVIGYFASGISNNFLTIPARVIRNNKPLQLKLEQEISKSIIRTRENVIAELKKHEAELLQNMEAQNEN